MVEFEIGKIRDQLGRPENKNIVVKRFSDTLIIEPNTLRFDKSSLGNSWIVGTSTNGIVGANTGTQGGGQQVVGGDSRVLVLQRVVNVDNTYREHFRHTHFKDSGNTTADWDTTNYRISMSADGNHARLYNTHATSVEIAYNDGTIASATFTATEHKWNSQDIIKYYLSANGGVDWEEFTLDVKKSFNKQGIDLRFKIIFAGNGGSESYVSDIKVVYA